MSKSSCSTILLGIFLLASVRANVSSDDATSDCQNTLVSCYEDALQDYDPEVYAQCSINAFNTYGRDVCIPCDYTMKEEYVPEFPKISSPDIPVDCLSNCYIEYLQTCTSFDQRNACDSACYPPPTSDATEKCQEEFLGCFSDFLDTNDETTYNKCTWSVFYGYGDNTCMPCLFNMTEAVALDSSKMSQTMNKECILNCVEQYMDDCNGYTLGTCWASCSPANSITTHTAIAAVFAESQNSSQSYASWSLIGAALACVSVLAGLALWRNNQKTPKSESQYHQLMA